MNLDVVAPQETNGTDSVLDLTVPTSGGGGGTADKNYRSPAVRKGARGTAMLLHTFLSFSETS